MRGFNALGAVFVVIVLLAAGWFLGTNNPETPAGYVGYVTQSAVFGSTRFLGLQVGPTSYGRTWLVHVVNVSVTPYTYDEEFTGDDAVLAKDNLKISFAVHLTWQIQSNGVKDFIEKYSAGDYSNPDKCAQDAYDNFVKQPLRTFARVEVQKYGGLDVKDNLDQIGSAIQDRVDALTKGTPYKVTNVVVGSVQYPSAVADAVSQKLAIQQTLEQKKTEIAITEAEAQKRVIEAQGIAKSMDIINQKLTTNYIQYQAIDAQKQVIGSPDHTVIYIPVGPMGVPIVATSPAPDNKGSGAVPTTMPSY
jgi:regulator of protease activity HflC (stomatin/prohibitin superfamily)